MEKELENKLDDMMRMVANGFEEVKTELRSEIRESKEELRQEIQKMKLDGLDKYATNERVDKQEVRIQTLETKSA